MHRLGPLDSGSTIAMRVGDRLEITLSREPSPDPWTLVRYPRNTLRAEPREPTSGRFTFVATGPGTGTVALSRSPCSPTMDRPCIVRQAPGPPPMGRRPPVPGRVYAVSVLVH